MLITVIVQYRLPPTIDLAACAEHFRKIAPGSRQVPGLIRKHSSTPRMAGRAAFIYGRAAPLPRLSTPDRGSKASASATAWTPRSAIFFTAAVTDNSREAVLLPDAAE
jgi:hypothetical protein